MKGKKFQSISIIILITFLPLYGLITPSVTTTRGSNPSFQTFVFNPNADTELVIYTHDSFMAWGDPDEYDFVMNQTFYNFGLLHDVSVIVQVFSGMVDALNVLISQKNAPQADVVIGLDNTMVDRAKNEGILLPLSSEINLENISSDLVTALDPEKYLLPIDYSLIALVFDTAYITGVIYPEITTLNFTTLLSTFGEDLALQDPTQSATGLNFLLYQIIFYEEVLGKNWQDWWELARDVVSIDKSWSDSWDRVFTTKNRHIMVSYATDPAYNAFFGYGTEKNAALIHNGTDEYGWLQIEGIGVINGTSDEALAMEYVKYALSLEVQNFTATNNWMFPSNTKVVLPTCYDYAITTEGVIILNNLVSSAYISANFLSWLNTWERLIYGSGLWWAWVLIATAIIFIGGITFYFIYKSKTKINVE
ncbi:MAG: thiamine ABC transporter substrate-binding protein [Candidatus Heimdallarchaeota archaeon]|nr:thiamine ABC transporter substrate-binding protein [Candidatus Heimdallarchaeota archaeon]